MSRPPGTDGADPAGTDGADPAGTGGADPADGARTVGTGGFAGGFLDALGAELGDVSADRAELTLPITPALHQPNGIVHGGVYATIVETLASLGGSVWLGERGHVVGVANHTDFLRATRAGTLHGVGTPIHRGRTQQLWLVEIFDGVPGADGTRLVARGEVRLANIASTDHLARG